MFLWLEKWFSPGAQNINDELYQISYVKGVGEVDVHAKECILKLK